MALATLDFWTRSLRSPLRPLLPVLRLWDGVWVATEKEGEV